MIEVVNSDSQFIGYGKRSGEKKADSTTARFASSRPSMPTERKSMLIRLY
jgi:hypothetical protein